MGLQEKINCGSGAKDGVFNIIDGLDNLVDTISKNFSTLEEKLSRVLYPSEQDVCVSKEMKEPRQIPCTEASIRLTNLYSVLLSLKSEMDSVIDRIGL